MNANIKFANGHVYEAVPNPVEIEPSLFGKSITQTGERREWERYTVESTYAEVAEDFINGAKYAVIQLEEVVDEKSVTTQEWVNYDKSAYCIAGDIVDHRDGRITVYMMQKSEFEKQLDEILSIVKGEEIPENVRVGTYADKIKSQIMEIKNREVNKNV